MCDASSCSYLTVHCEHPWDSRVDNLWNSASCIRFSLALKLVDILNSIKWANIALKTTTLRCCRPLTDHLTDTHETVVQCFRLNVCMTKEADYHIQEERHYSNHPLFSCGFSVPVTHFSPMDFIFKMTVPKKYPFSFYQLHFHFQYIINGVNLFTGWQAYTRLSRYIVQDMKLWSFQLSNQIHRLQFLNLVGFNSPL